jgi:multiple sugar transport system substrate-binding protein
MYKNSKWYYGQLLSMVCAVILIVTACGSGDEAEPVKTGNDIGSENKATVDTKPVTIKFSRQAGYVMEPIDNAIKVALAKKYPNITLEFSQQDKGNSIEEQVAAGKPADIYQGSPSILNSLKPLKLDFDLTPLIKSRNFDISQIAPNLLDSVRLKAEDRKALYALPYANGFNILYYNKDIFDKFGVPYPKDGMTWEQTFELAKNVTRQDGGVQYYGIANTHNWYRPFKAQFGLPLVDAKTSKAAVNTDGWQRAFGYAKQMYSANGTNDPKLYTEAQNLFVKEQRLAMLVADNITRNMSEMNWDIVSIPSTADNPGIGGASPFNIMTIASSSKEKEAAFQVLEVVFSDEVQSAIAKYGMVSSLKDDKYKKLLGQDIPGVSSRNIQAIFSNKPAPLVDETDLDDYVNKEMAAALKEVLADKTDINTALREAEQRGNASIAASGLR